MPQLRTNNESTGQSQVVSGRRRAGEPRRLIAGLRVSLAGLRVSLADEQLLALVEPFFPEVDSAGDLAYRLWRRGLELALAELASVGVPLPASLPEEQLATLVAQRVTGCLPLLRRTGKLALLHLEIPPAQPEPERHSSVLISTEIDSSAAMTVVGLGGADFI